jgi:creatinine amidohydrolase
VSEKFLARHTTATLYTLLKEGKRPVVALVPIGSTEPHGPHLGLGTDVVISAAACVRACEVMEKKGPLAAVVAPAVSYGVTDCAVGFPGAISIPADVLTAYVAAICDGLLAQGLRHVCLVNNHLEPAHDAAIRAVVTGREGKVSVACPLTRKWAKTLSAEFKSGACHAGQYETSIIMAAAPELVDEQMRTQLQPVPVSLSEKLAAGVTTFTAMGMELAYAGNPAGATVEEGDQLINRLAEMVIGEIREALGLPS